MMNWPEPAGDPESRGGKQMRPSWSVDERLTLQVSDLLRIDAERRFDHVVVEVQNGVALLSGFVAAPAHRELAGHLARDVEGVRDVANRLRLTPSGGQPMGARSAAGSDRPAPVRDPVEARETGTGSARAAAQRQTQASAALVLCLAICWWLLWLLLLSVGWFGSVIWGLLMAVGLHLFMSRMRRRRTAHRDRAGDDS